MNNRKRGEKKHKFITKGVGEEPTVIEFNLSKAVILLIIIGVIIAGIVTKEILTTIIEAKQTELLANDEAYLQSTRSRNGDLGYINSVDLKEVKTGTGPFDKNDEEVQTPVIRSPFFVPLHKKPSRHDTSFAHSYGVAT